VLCCVVLCCVCVCVQGRQFRVIADNFQGPSTTSSVGMLQVLPRIGGDGDGSNSAQLAAALGVGMHTHLPYIIFGGSTTLRDL